MRGENTGSWSYCLVEPHFHVASYKTQGKRLEAGDTNIARSNSPVSALCIAAPKGAWFSGLFSTHPPIPDRIARLRNLGGVAVSESEPAPAPDTQAVEPHRHGGVGHRIVLSKWSRIGP